MSPTFTPDAHANLAFSTVQIAPNPALSGVELTVQTGTGVRFPEPPFNAVVTGVASALVPIPLPAFSEIVRVTAISGDMFTIVRATNTEPTPLGPRAIVSGDQIVAAITAKTLMDIEAALNSEDEGAAPLVSPAFTGTPTAPTQTALDASTKLATTAYSDAGVAVEKTRAVAAEGALTTSKASLAALLSGLPEATTLTTAGALAANGFTPCDGTAGAFTAPMPSTGSLAYGALVAAEKIDSSANAVTISGTFRGVAGTITLSLQHETVLFFYEGGGSFRPLASHKTLGSLDARYTIAGASGPGLLPISVGNGRSTDGSFGLPAPTGVGLELVITADELQEINFNGVSL